MSRVSESTTQMPSGLRIESAVVCSFPRVVRTRADHEVLATNRSMNAFVVSIKATCESSELCYSMPTGHVASLTDSMRIPSRPGRGGKGVGSRTYELSSLGRSRGATIRVDLVAEPEGFPHAANDSLSVQVNTA